MYDFRPNTVIGFHGCDLNIRNSLVNDPNNIEISRKPHDWLGHGMYFWENNYTRAMEWAEQRDAILELFNKDITDNHFSNIKIFDSTRGVFTEGGPAFAGAGILEKSHIQVCIRNMNCIKGFFIPRDESPFP